MKRFGNIPLVSLEPSGKSGWGHACNRGPFLESFYLTHVLNKANTFLVARLFLLRGPSAIFRRIAKIVVDSFYRASVRPFPHIKNEVLEGDPSLAYGYPAPSVSREKSIASIPASIVHGGPDFIDRGLALSVSGSRLCLKAPAGLLDSASQGTAESNDAVPAVADAVPGAPSSNVLCCGNHGEPAKLFPAKIASLCRKPFLVCAATGSGFPLSKVSGCADRGISAGADAIPSGFAARASGPTGDSKPSKLLANKIGGVVMFLHRFSPSRNMDIDTVYPHIATEAP